MHLLFNKLSFIEQKKLLSELYDIPMHFINEIYKKQKN